jgi:hypothetical protein
MKVGRILVHTVLVCTILLPLALASCNGSNGSATIPETTQVLDEATLNYLSGASVNSSTLVFENTTEQLSSLSVGDILVSGISDVTPYGLLRKVTKVASDETQVVVETSPATLGDAIEDCSIDTSWRLESDGSFIPLETSESGDALVESAEVLATGFYLQLSDVVLYDNDGNLDTEGDQITADLSINLNIDVDIGWTIGWFQMTEAHFQSTVSVTSEVETSCKITILEIHPKLEVYRQYLAPFTVMVGPVPVVVLPMLSINIGLDGEVSAGITAGVTANAELTAGVRYTDGDWSPITDFSTSFDWQEPSLTAGCEVKVYAGPQLSLLLYGGAGPYTEVRGYLELDADIFRTPWWELYGGLEVDVGFKVEAMGHEIADYEKPLAIGYRVLLAQAETPSPSPLGQAVDNTGLAWSTTGDADWFRQTTISYYDGDAAQSGSITHGQGTSLETTVTGPGTLTFYWKVSSQSNMAGHDYLRFYIDGDILTENRKTISVVVLTGSRRATI